MKTVFFTYLLLDYGGGVATYFITTTSGLKKYYPNSEITILTFDKKLLRIILFIYSLYFTKKSDFNFKKETTKLKNVNYQKSNNIFSIINVLKENNVIYTTNNLLELLVLKIISFFTRIPPVIVGFHIPVKYYQTPSFQSKLHNIIYSSKFYQQLLKNAHAFHVINKHDYRLLKVLFPSKKIHLIYNPILINSTTTEQKHLFNPNRKKINLLWLGRITEQKGITDLIQLIGNINKTAAKNKVIWHIVGSGDMETDVKKMSQKYNNVKYYGYIENKYISFFYKNSDFFISTSNWESFPYTILEAQSHGLPVICYDIPGCSDIVVQNKTGYKARTLNDLSKKVVYLVSQSKRPFSRSYIKKSIQKKFNQDIIYRELHFLFTYGKTQSRVWR